MTLHEILSISVSLLAAVIATVALVRSGSISKRQLELEERHAELAEKQLVKIKENEEARSQAYVDVELERIGSDGIFAVSNIGTVSAFDVRCRIDPHEPIFERDLEEKFPVRELRAGKTIELRAAFSMASPIRYVANVWWSNPDGSNKQDEFELHL